VDVCADAPQNVFYSFHNALSVSRAANKLYIG